MDKRTRILLITFTALIVLWAGYKTVYVSYIAPLFNLERDIASLEEKKDEAAEFNAGYEFARRDYEKLVSRVGTLDLGELKNSLHHRIEDLAHQHALEDLKVSPKREQRYGKTDASELGFSISGQQKLASVLSFLRDLYELPHVIRIVDPKLSPVVPPRDEKPKDLVKLSLDLNALLLPGRPRAALAYTVDPKKLPPQPEKFVRHGDPDIMRLASAKPFLEYEPERTIRPTPPTQERGTKPPPPPEKIVCKPWTGKWRVVAISMMHEPEGANVLVQDTTRATHRKLIHIGQEFDGGMLDSVSTLGALVRYHDKVYVYPLGEEFSRRIEAGAADAFPELKARSETIQPLTENEIRALGGLAGESVAALTTTTGSSRTTGTNSPRPPVTSGSGAAPSSRTTATPGRLSTPSRVTVSPNERAAGSNSPARPPAPPPAEPSEVDEQPSPAPAEEAPPQRSMDN